MQARSSGEVYRRLFREINKEKLPWISSGRTITPKCTFSGGSFEKRNLLPCSQENRILTSSMRSSILWIKGELSTKGVDLVMVRKVEGLGGLRGMGVTHRPAARAATHGARTVLPMSDEERHTDEFLRQEKMKQAAKVMRTEQQVAGVAGQSLTATDAEFRRQPGSNTADKQKDIASEMTRKSELGADHVDPKSTSGHDWDANGEHLSVDEEVKRGLVADSAFPMGRKEKVDEDEKSGDTWPDGFNGEIKGNVSEHGSFKTL